MLKRILIRDAVRHSFLGRDGGWTSDVNAARNFETALDAVTFCLMAEFTHAEVVMKFPGTDDVFVGVTPHMKAASRRAASTTGNPSGNGVAHLNGRQQSRPARKISENEMADQKTSKPRAEGRSHEAAMRDMAERFVAHEAKGKKSAEPNTPADFGGVVEKLREPLAMLMGAAGFRSLLSRALALGSDKVRWLGAVQIKADGTLEIPADMSGFEPEEMATGEVEMVAQLLALLVTFIGEALTLRLMEDVWPKALKDNSIFSKEQK